MFNITIRAIKDFSLLYNNKDIYHLLINIGSTIESFNVKYKTDNTKIPGCITQAWLLGQKNSKKIYYIGYSDPSFIKSLIFIILFILSSRNTLVALKINILLIFNILDFNNALSYRRHISFSSIWLRIKNIIQSILH